MTYTSYLFFFGFAVIVFMVYSLVPVKRRWIVLLVGSCLFYAVNSGFSIIYLAVTTLTSFFCAQKLTRIQDDFKAAKKELSKEEKKKLKDKVTKKKKLFAGAAIVFNLGILAFLKYYNFFAEQVTNVFGLFHLDFEMPLVRLLLPLGISYYTLQAIGYIVDTYRGKYKAEKNFAKLALFLSFFPQMTEGPIGRYDALMPQLYKGHTYSNENFTGGIILVLWGFFKKLVISDRISYIVGVVFSDYNDYSGLLIAISAICYTIQLYTDFSGCIDIMTGISKMFGIELAVNFRQPFFSRSVAEFWRRWHITLGTWFKDYVFYSVSLSEPFMKLSKTAAKHFNKFFASVIPSAVALFVVWFCTGIWHGASYKYVAYGLYYFLIILIGTLLEPVFAWLSEKTKANRKGKLWGTIAMLRTLVLVVIGMMMFRADSLMDFFRMFLRMITTFDFNEVSGGLVFTLGTDKHDFFIIAVGLIIMFVVDILKERGTDVLSKVAAGKIYIKWPVMIGLIMMIVVFGAYGKNYGAVDNIYAQF